MKGLIDKRYIPGTWTVLPLKYAVNFRSDNLPEGTDSDYEFRYVDIGSVSEDRGVAEVESIRFEDAPSRARKRVKTGDVIVSTVRTYLKAIAKIYDDDDVIVSTGFSVIEPRRVTSEYLYYLMRSDAVCNEISKLSWGIAYPAVSESLMGRIMVPVPPRNEQMAIANELDQGVARLDSAIALLGRQIETLESYRRSLIQEVVTKGLDPSVPMKDSGSKWFGRIPEHWTMKPFKYIAVVDAHLVDPNNYQDLIEIDPENIVRDTGTLHDVVSVGDVGAISDKQLFKKGQLIYSKIRPALNKVLIAPEDGLCSADMYPLLTTENKQWLLQAMRAPSFVEQTKVIASRVKMPKINVLELGRIMMAVPPREEQVLIADFLESRTAEIDSAESIKREQLETLRKERQSLIYEYVTGKRRVKMEA